MAINTVKATINGQEVSLTLNTQTGKYEATVQAPQKSSYNQSGHYYGVTIKATDKAGNVRTVDTSDATLGASLRLVVKEKVAPIITMTSPTNGATIINNKPVITWKVTDADSGVDTGTIGIAIDSGTVITGDKITKTATTGGYSCSYTPDSALSDGSHTIKLTASDNDGNVAAQVTVTIKVDTVPPTLTINAPADNLQTNTANVTVTGVTNDVTSSPVTVTITVNGTDAGAITVDGGGNFSKSVTLPREGSNTISVVSRDSAGKTTTVNRTVIKDTVAPTIAGITLTPNPVDAGKTFIISCTVTD